MNRLLTFLLAGLAAASVQFWLLQWQPKSALSQIAVAPAPTVLIDSSKVAFLLGAKTAPDKGQTLVPSLQSTSKLLGVISLGSSGAHGSALIAVEGKPAKPYLVGDVVTEGVVLQFVKPRSVVLGPPGQTSGTFVLELPLLQGIPEAP